jgi:predicted dehydrogenase
MTHFKSAIIGCGAIGSLYDKGRQGLDPYSHAGAYAAHQQTHLVAGADTDPGRRAEFTRMWGVTTYADYHTLLEHERPDIVSVCTWPASHQEIVQAALAAGAQAIFCEKPLAATLAEARQLVSACEASQVPLAVNHLRRWDTAHQQVRDLLARRELGDVQHVTVHYVRGLANSGSHIADLLRFFWGEAAWGRAFNRLNEADPDPALDGYLAMRNGIGCALVGVRRGYYDLFELDVVGTTGRLRLEDLGYQVQRWTIGSHADFPGTPVLVPIDTAFAPGMRGMMVAAVDNLVRALVNGAELLDTGRDGLAALEIVTALQLSAAAGGQRIDLPLCGGI